ncbi:uncharacterized protein LOC131621657 [Vicia villosa]|uniref:uncharacterized protein LOC131621657 n=1 Tax=Vicia villosa TaxID=3911 RepID=UPI00273A8B3B|nr:uncharacterized protein LOC131621657 [Vicia villosa]
MIPSNANQLRDLLRAYVLEHEGAVLGPEIVQQSVEKIKMIQEKMKASHNIKKSYHDNLTKILEFQKDNHVLLRVTLVTDVGRALKSKKLTSCFIGPYQILKRVGEVAYKVALLLSLSNLHYVFHVSQLQKCVANLSHVIQMNDVQVIDNLTVEASPLQIDDREVKHSREKEIVLVKVVWRRPA